MIDRSANYILINLQPVNYFLVKHPMAYWFKKILKMTVQRSD